MSQPLTVMSLSEGFDSIFTIPSRGQIETVNQAPVFCSSRGDRPGSVSAFPDELYQAPRSWVETTFLKLIHYNRFPRATTSPRGSSPIFTKAEIKSLSVRSPTCGAPSTPISQWLPRSLATSAPIQMIE
jgi:hypothetical protein